MVCVPRLCAPPAAKVDRVMTCHPIRCITLCYFCELRLRTKLLNAVWTKAWPHDGEHGAPRNPELGALRSTPARRLGCVRRAQRIQCFDQVAALSRMRRKRCGCQLYSLWC